MKRCIPIAVILFLLSFVFAFGAEELVPEPAYISYIVGGVDVDLTPDNDMEDFTEAKMDMSLPLGSLVRTGKDALCELTLLDGSMIRISSGSVFQIETVSYDSQTTKKKGRFKLVFGRARSKVEKLTTKDSRFEVVSGTALAGVRGTSYGVAFDGVTSQVLVFDGSVSFESLEGLFEPVRIEEGMMSSVREGGVPDTPRAIPPEVLDEWEAELRRFAGEQAPAAAEAAPVQEPPKPKEQPKPKQKEGFLAKHLKMNAYVGTVTIDDLVYARWIITPEFSISKLGVGLYLPAIFSPNVGIFGFNDWENHDEWDFVDLRDGLHDALIKIYYIRWGERGDPLYVKVGNIDDFYLGHGFIMDNYSNMLYFPEELNTGMQFNVDGNRGGIETVVSRFDRLELYGGRIYLRPLGRRIPFAFGVTAVHDKPEPVSNYWPIGPGAELTQNEDQLPRILTVGGDVELPIINLDVFSLMLYADAAKMGYMYKELHPALVQYELPEGAVGLIKGLGTGAGVMGKIARIFSYRVEYRYIFDYYEPGYINYLWENRRLSYQQELLDVIIAQQDPNYESSTTSGILIKGGLVLLKKLEFGLGYENYEVTTGASTEKVHKGNAYVTLSEGLIPKVSGDITYNRGANFNKVFSDPFDESTLVEINGYYALAPMVSLAGGLKRTYRYNDATGENDPIDSFSITTIFTF